MCASLLRAISRSTARVDFDELIAQASPGHPSSVSQRRHAGRRQFRLRGRPMRRRAINTCRHCAALSRLFRAHRVAAMVFPTTLVRRTAQSARRPPSSSRPPAALRYGSRAQHRARQHRRAAGARSAGRTHARRPAGGASSSTRRPERTARCSRSALRVERVLGSLPAPPHAIAATGSHRTPFSPLLAAAAATLALSSAACRGLAAGLGIDRDGMVVTAQHLASDVGACQSCARAATRWTRRSPSGTRWPSRIPAAAISAAAAS